MKWLIRNENKGNVFYYCVSDEGLNGGDKGLYIKRSNKQKTVCRRDLIKLGHLSARIKLIWSYGLKTNNDNDPNVTIFRLRL
jgi:hypothetical protein